MNLIITFFDKIRILLLGVIFLLCTYPAKTQVEVSWTKDLPGDVLWVEVTALGNLIASTSNQLVGIDPSTGEVKWAKPEFSGVSKNTFKELSNSPFFTLTYENTIFACDQFSGKEVFNSKKAGIKTIDDYFFLYNSNIILLAGKDAGNQPIMVAVNMADANVSWSINEKFGKIIAVNELGNKELLIVTLFNNYKIDGNDGKIIWKEASSPEAAQVEKMGALGDLLKNYAEDMTKDMEFDLRFYRPEKGNVFYLGTQKEQKSSMHSSDSKPIITYTNEYYAFNIDDGSLVWKKPLEVKGKIGHVTFLDDGILVLPDDGNRTKINLYDYETQEGKWGSKGKGRGLPIKGGVYDFLDTGDGILLVSQTSNNNFLNFLDASTGTITFDKPVKVDGRVVGIVPMTNGILYITTESMNILNQRTGTLKWDKDVNTTPQLTSEADGKIYAFDTKSRTLKVVDLSNGSVREMSGVQIKFEGGESPRKIEVMGDGIFIYSDQNVAKIDYSGKLLFQNYFPAPREPGWKRALMYAEAVRGAYIGAKAYYVSGAMNAIEGEVRKEDAVAGDIVGQIGDAYDDLGDQASSYAKEAFQMANARFKASMSARDFMLIMSKTDKTIDLLKVSKTTGNADGAINLGKDKEPVYAVDDVTGLVFLRSDTKQLTAYSVK